MSDFHAWIFLGWKAYQIQCLIGQHEQIHWLSFLSSEPLTILYSLRFWNASPKVEVVVRKGGHFDHV